VSLLGRYDIRVETLGARKYTWSIWHGKRLVAQDLDPVSGVPRIYSRLKDASDHAARRYAKLAALDEQILDLVSRVYGYDDDDLRNLVEVLEMMAEDAEDRVRRAEAY